MGGLDHRHGGAPLRAAAAGGDLGGSALAPGGKDAVRGDEPVPVLDGVAHRRGVAHGIVGGVQRLGGELDAAAREEHGVAWRNIVGTQDPGRRQRGGEENGGAVGPLGAARGLVHHTQGALTGIGGPQGGGAASVQGHRLHTAQLDQAHSHLLQRRAHTVPGLVPVNGVEEDAAVLLQADGGAGPAGLGIGVAVEAGVVHLSGVHQAAGRAGGLHHLGPPGVAGGKVHLHRIPGLQGLEGRGGGLAALVVDREDIFPAGDGCGGGGFHHLVHCEGHAAHDGRGLPPGEDRSVLPGDGLPHPVQHGGQDHIHARAGVAGGAAEIAVEEHIAPIIAAHLVEAAGDVVGLAPEAGPDGNLGLADEGRPVLPEADAVVPGAAPLGAVRRRGGAQDAVGDDDALGRAGGKE